MKSSIYKEFQNDFPSHYFKRIGDNRHLSLYIGRDDDGRYSFDFRGSFAPVRIPSSNVIAVEQFNDEKALTLRFSLENSSLLEYFCTFCEDLLESTNIIVDDDTAYKTLRSRFFSWRQLFKPNSGRMSEQEVMGLIGELLFLQKYLIPKMGADSALDSWTGPEKLHKDFSFDSEWYEVKTVSFGKESVKISSAEQLDGDTVGYLCVYELERMSANFNGIRVNQLVKDIISELDSAQQRELFMDKLNLYGFDFSQEYDQLVFVVKNYTVYMVDSDNFPRIRKNVLPDAICKISYEIQLSKISQFVVSLNI
jgi:hypothetical protein